GAVGAPAVAAGCREPQCRRPGRRRRVKVSAAAQLRASQWLLAAWILLGALGLVLPQPPALLSGLGSDVLGLGTVLLVALVVGVPLGALAGSGPRWVDAALSFTTDGIAAVP